MKCLSNQTLKGIYSDCDPNLAGIAEAYIGYYGDFDVTIEASAHQITAITADASAETGNFYAFEFAKQTGSLTSTLTKDEANGTRYFTNQVVLQFTKLEAAKHLEMQALSAEKLVAIIKDNNGKYWYVGYDSYLSSTEGTAQTGQSYDDLNGYNVTMNQMSAYLPFELSESAISAFKALISA